MFKIDEDKLEPLREDPIKDQMLMAVNLFEDLQKVRIAMCNRICAAYYCRIRNDVEDDDSNKDIDSQDNSEIDKKVEQAIIKGIVVEYNKINIRANKDSEHIKRASTVIKESNDLQYILNQYDYLLVHSYVSLLDNEDSAEKLVENIVKQHPMWNLFFKDVKGVGAIIAGRLLAKLDIHTARHVSDFWAYCGVGTLDDEYGVRVAMTKKVTISRSYIDKNGEEKEKRSIVYNPQMQSLVCYNLVSSILRTGRGSKYAKCYYDYKNRYRNRVDLEGISNIHLHRMAARQVAKAVLRDLWVTWRKYEGYEVTQPYEIEYLGRAEHEYNEYHARLALNCKSMNESITGG